jgi:hypothetical protein
VGQAKRAFENRKKPLTFTGLQKAELLHLLDCFRDINIIRRGNKFLRLDDLLAEVLELDEQLLDVIRRFLIEELVSYSCTGKIVSTLRYRSVCKVMTCRKNPSNMSVKSDMTSSGSAKAFLYRTLTTKSAFGNCFVLSSTFTVAGSNGIHRLLSLSLSSAPCSVHCRSDMENWLTRSATA